MLKNALRPAQYGVKISNASVLQYGGGVVKRYHMAAALVGIAIIMLLSAYAAMFFRLTRTMDFEHNGINFRARCVSSTGYYRLFAIAALAEGLYYKVVGLEYRYIIYRGTSDL